MFLTPKLCGADEVKTDLGGHWTVEVGHLQPNRWADAAQIWHGASLVPKVSYRLLKLWVGVPKRVPILMPKTLKCNFEGEGGL